MRNIQHIDTDLSDRLSAFGASAEGTSLYLLRAIESTVDRLEADERLAVAIAENANLLTGIIRQREPVVGRMLDSDDKVITGLESAYHSLEQHLPKMLLMKQSVDADEQLNDGHCDLLHSAFDRNIAAFAALIESTKNLRAAVITHDLAAESRNQQSFENLDGVIANLRSSPTV